MNIEFGEEIPR